MRPFWWCMFVGLVSACAGDVSPFEISDRGPSGAARVLVVAPGAEIPAEDIPLEARQNLEAAMKVAVQARGHGVVEYERGGAGGASGRQTVLLHDAVADTLLAVQGRTLELRVDEARMTPRTLGPGAQALARSYSVDYALIMAARGKSGAAENDVAPSVVGPIRSRGVDGERDLVVSLVDLTNGEVVWFNAMETNVRKDFRRSDETRMAVDALVMEMPL